ncbi:MAG: hypothetical protein V4735_07495 [Pseudomonadota bacterium]
MNKYKELTKQTVRMTIMALIVVAAAGGVFAAVSMISGNIDKRKTDAESKYASDSGMLTSLKSQLNKSGEAEKRFVAIQLNRPSPDFSSSLETLKDVLSKAKGQYGFGQFTLTRADELPTDKAELANFNFNITVRPRMSLTIQAVSDVHIFSFIDDLQRTAPGLIRIESLQLKRTKDMDDAAISQLRGGQLPMQVEGKIEFSQIGVVPKAADAAPGAPATPASVPGQ